jgi:hypothetical protein
VCYNFSFYIIQRCLHWGLPFWFGLFASSPVFRTPYYSLPFFRSSLETLNRSHLLGSSFSCVNPYSPPSQGTIEGFIYRERGRKRKFFSHSLYKKWGTSAIPQPLLNLPPPSSQWNARMEGEEGKEPCWWGRERGGGERGLLNPPSPPPPKLSPRTLMY